MAGATSKLSILIEAKNNASGAINTVKSDLSGLDKAAGSISGGLGALAGAAGVAGLVALGTAAVGAAIDLAKTAAETERLGTAFDNLAGQAGSSGDAMLAAMQQASQGTISNAELMASANRAMLLGVADSAGEMAQLLDVAAARGKAMGETTAQAFSDLVTGIGRMSPMILDNLGITVDAAKANEEYAKSVGKTTAQLTDAEKKQALLNAVVADSTQIIKDNKAAGDDAASNFERMDAAISNAKDSLGALFSPAVAAIAQSIADATVKATEGMQHMAEEQGKVNQGWDLGAMRTQIEFLTTQIGQAEIGLQKLSDEGVTSGEVWDRLTNSLALMHAQLGATKQQLLEMSAGADAAAAEHQKLDIQLNFTVDSLKQVGPAAQAAAMGLDAMGQRLPWLTGQLAALKAQSDATSAALAGIASSAIGAIHSAASAAVGLMPSGEIAKIYGENTKKINEQIKVMHEVGMSQDEIDFKTQEMAKNASAPFDIAVEAARAADKALTHHASSVDEVSKAYSDLEGKVQGVLSGALDPGVGVNPDDLLPRADAINEDARRLADVAVNGWASPWAEYFKNTFPEQFQEMTASSDIKQGAALMLRNFQDGLEPELISKEKVKERVRKMLVGDENMAALATEIATELSQEMGVPMQEALAATQGAMGGGSGMGTEAATSFADGASQALDEGNGGGAFVTKFTDQMKASYGLLSQAGTEAGKQWGAAFLAKVGESVPPALISILTDLITPQVIAQLGQRGTLTGATP